MRATLSADESEAVRTSLEHLIPKAKAAEFTELVSLVARDFCCEERPNRKQCPLRPECEGEAEVGVELCAVAEFLLVSRTRTATRERAIS